MIKKVEKVPADEVGGRVNAQDDHRATAEEDNHRRRRRRHVYDSRRVRKRRLKARAGIRPALPPIDVCTVAPSSSEYLRRDCRLAVSVLGPLTVGRQSNSRPSTVDRQSGLTVARAVHFRIFGEGAMAEAVTFVCWSAVVVRMAVRCSGTSTSRGALGPIAGCWKPAVRKSLPRPPPRLPPGANSPTRPRRAPSTMTTKMKPWITSTSWPTKAR